VQGYTTALTSAHPPHDEIPGNGSGTSYQGCGSSPSAQLRGRSWSASTDVLMMAGGKSEGPVKTGMCLSWAACDPRGGEQ
jgi:hypothetical protein